MKNVTFPLEPQMQGVEVANLQAGLQAFINKGAILTDDKPAREKLSTLLQQEQATQQYGRATQTLVSIFQRAATGGEWYCRSSYR